MSATSSSLLREAKAANADAWERLVTLYTPLVYRWCRREGLQPADTADVGQEVFQAVARKLPEFRLDRPGDTFRGWLRTITRHKVDDFRRKRGRHPELTGGDGPERPERSRREPDEDGEAAEGVLLLAQVLKLARREAEPRTWAAFWATAVDGRPPADVAAELGMTENAVRLAKSRTLRKLRELVESLPDRDF